MPCGRSSCGAVSDGGSSLSVPVEEEHDGPVTVPSLGNVHLMVRGGMLLFMLLLGFVGGRCWSDCTRPKVGGMKMMKLKPMESEDESDGSYIPDVEQEEAAKLAAVDCNL